MSRGVTTILREFIGRVVNEWIKLFDAFVRLLTKVVKRVKRKGEEIVYDVSECDVVIVCTIENMKEAFKV